MERVKYKKVYDFNLSVNNPIKGGRIEHYWNSNGLKTRYKALRTPLFPFKDSIDYLDQQYICKTYKLKGFEFGNWVTQEERLNFLVSSHIALFDLHKIAQFPASNIGFSFKLGIGFGARGHSAALAHFEPDTFMINLTRFNGWQSLAHEYGHALDFYFGGYIDQSKESFSLSGGHSTVKYIDLTEYKKGSLRYLMNDLINNINTITINGKINDSDSLKSLKKAVSGDDYWFRRTEIFARFFERYVMYRLSKLGIKNYFLAKEKYTKPVYITKTDFARVLPKMTALLKAMKSGAAY